MVEVVEVVNPEAAWPVTGCTTPTTTRTMDNHWYLPFCRRMDILYPSGIRHIIVNAATPVEDGKLQLVQLLFRNEIGGGLFDRQVDRLGTRRSSRRTRRSSNAPTPTRCWTRACARRSTCPPTGPA